MKTIAHIDQSFGEDRSIASIVTMVKGRLDRIYFQKYGETFSDMQRRCVSEMAIKNQGKDI